MEGATACGMLGCSNRELITELYVAFNRRDAEAVLARMRPDVDWPNAMEGVRLTGADEVRAYWERQWSTVDPHVEPVRIAEGGNGEVLVEVHRWCGTSGARCCSTRWWSTWTGSRMG